MASDAGTTYDTRHYDMTAPWYGDTGPPFQRQFWPNFAAGEPSFAKTVDEFTGLWTTAVANGKIAFKPTPTSSAPSRSNRADGMSLDSGDMYSLQEMFWYNRHYWDDCTTAHV